MRPSVQTYLAIILPHEQPEKLVRFGVFGLRGKEHSNSGAGTADDMGVYAYWVNLDEHGDNESSVAVESVGVVQTYWQLYLIEPLPCPQ